MLAPLIIKRDNMLLLWYVNMFPLMLLASYNQKIMYPNIKVELLKQKKKEMLRKETNANKSRKTGFK